MEDWDLQAVVRGFSSGTSLDSPLFCFDPFHNDQQDDLISSFPCDEELFETRREILDELDQLYKPFYPLFQPLTTTSISAATEAKEEEQLQKEEATPMADTTAATVRLRRRKNQQKRVVKQVMMDGLSSDTWAWRKYGQKPIKGSPYPRSYYRCSSSKGCLARKQVERCRIDPNMFIITYTADHSHPHPIRRKSLKLSLPKGTDKEKSTADLSPATTLLETIKEELTQRAREKEMGKQEEVERVGKSEDRNICTPDITLSNDLFLGLEELDCFAENSSRTYHPWYSNEVAIIGGDC